jgi:hypothetical protein
LIAAATAESWVVLAMPVVLTICWWCRERTKRNSRTALIRAYRELLTDLDELGPDQVERLHDRLQWVRPPSDETRPPPVA